MTRVEAVAASVDTRVDREAALAEVRRLRRDGKREAAIRLALYLAERFGDDAGVQADAALALDEAAQPEAAIEHYERALALDIRGAARLDCLIGLGNALRLAGRPREAVAQLAAARREYPHDGAVQVFYALAQCATGHWGRGAGELLAAVLNTTASGRIRLYEHALRAESDRLTQAAPNRRRRPAAAAAEAPSEGG